MHSEAELTRRAVWTAVFAALFMMAQLVASRAIRDGFFLTHFSASDLPKMVIGSSLLSVAVVLASSRLLRQVPPARSMPWMFAFSGFLFVLEWLFAMYHPQVAAVVLYLHVMSIGLLVASGFWSVVNERFDPYTAKLSIGRIGGGATLGGVLGGVLAWVAAQKLDVSGMILALALTNLGCAIVVKRLGAGSRPVSGAARKDDAAISILTRNPYLLNLALLVTLGAFCQACYEYVFKSSVAAVYVEGSELVSFFALFYMGLNIVTFLVQNLLTHRMLRNYGLSFTVGSLPGTGALLGVVALFFPGLGSAMVMRGGIGAVENSLFRSGYELLYTPVLPEQKRPTKTLIDVGGEMTGAVLGGLAAFLVLAIVPAIANPLLVLAGIAASVAGLYLTRRIRLGYVRSLAETLEAGNVDMEEAAFGSMQQALTPGADGSAAQGRPTRAGTAGSGAGNEPATVSRTELNDYMAQRRVRNGPQDAATSVPPWRYAPREPLPIPPGPAQLDSLTRAVAHLRSGEATAVRRVLSTFRPLPGELLASTLPLLARDDLAESAETALLYVAPVHTGALLDALRSADFGLPVKRRLCRLLGEVPTQRTVDGLLSLLDDTELELRLRIAAALLRIRRNNLELEFDRQRIFDLAERESRISHLIWRARASLDPRVTSTPALESREGQRVLQGFTYISTLLMTVLDQQPAALAARSLAHSSSARRGTGIEYFENVLPARLFQQLKPLLVDSRLALGRAISRAEVLARMENE